MSQPGPTSEPQTDTFQGRLEHDQLSDIGLRCANNQDSMAVVLASSKNVWQQRGDLFMVADGMGAHAAGELASKLSTDTIPLVYQKLADRTPAEAMLAAVQEANTQINNRGQASVDFKGMGTTTTVLTLLPYGALLAHVGDSRPRLSPARNAVGQLTFDHSLVWEMRAAGQLHGPVPDYVPKNVITRSLGPNPTVQVDLEGPHPIVPGDTFLMCSDGLTGPIKDEELGMILASVPPAEAVRSLVDLANLRGGPDNITVIVAKATGTGWTQSAEAPQPRAAARPIDVKVWIAMGVLTLLGLGLLLTPQTWIPAALCLVASGVLGVETWFYRQGGEVKGPAMNGKRYGRGPYTAAVCTPSQDFVRRLAEMLRELREAASRAGVDVKLDALNPILDRAAAGNQAGDYAQAVRNYCQAISFLVAEFKRQGKSRK